MKKYFFLVAAVAAGLAFTSCTSSKESAYRKAYEKAKAQEAAQQQAVPAQSVQVQQPVQQYVQQPVQQQAPVVTPMVQAPVQTPVQAAPAPTGNVAVRSERVSVVSGSGLKAYSVVVGSFGVRANAESLQGRLKNAGYDAQVAYNQDRNMYRVVISTFDNRDSAAQSKQSISGTYPDAWLLMQQ